MGPRECPCARCASAATGAARRPPVKGPGTSGDPSLDHLIRPLQERRRDRQAEGLGGLEVDDELELRGLLDGEVARLGAFEDLERVPCSYSITYPRTAGATSASSRGIIRCPLRRV